MKLSGRVALLAIMLGLASDVGAQDRPATVHRVALIGLVPGAEAQLISLPDSSLLLGQFLEVGSSDWTSHGVMKALEWAAAYDAQLIVVKPPKAADPLVAGVIATLRQRGTRVVVVEE